MPKQNSPWTTSNFRPSLTILCIRTHNVCVELELANITIPKYTTFQMKIRAQTPGTRKLRKNAKNHAKSTCFGPYICPLAGKGLFRVGKLLRSLEYIFPVYWQLPMPGLKALATIPYFNFHFFPHLLMFLQFRDPSNVLNLSTKAVLQKCHN